MRRVVVGVDGGGTKTDVVVADLDGAALATVNTGGTNHESIGIAAMADVLGAALDRALGEADADRTGVAAAVFGLAGVDWPSDVERVERAIGELGLSGSRSVLNDCQVALRAGCTQPFGIVSSVGTGSVTAGRNRDGRWFRTMAIGWGEPSGGGTIVRAALDAVARQHHRTGPRTTLSDVLPDALGMADPLAMFEAISRRRVQGVRDLGPVVSQAAADGDSVAEGIIDDIARRHADVAIGVATHLDMLDDDFELVTAGAIHAAGGLFSQSFERRLGRGCPGATIVALTVPPALGAVSLALDLVAADPPC